jgi:hypothetical protein
MARITISFFITFFVVILVVGGIETIRTDSLNGFFFGIEVAVMIVCLILPIAVFIDIIYRLAIWKKYGKFDTNLKVKRKLLVKGNAKDIIFKIIKILNKMKGITVRDTNEKLGLIIARGKTTLRASSQDIFVKIFSGTGPNSTVEITSKPHNRLMLMDFSKNVENVERILKMLEQEKEKDSSLD